MSVLMDLVLLYEHRGYHAASGLDREHTNDPLSEFTWLFQGDALLTEHLGIALKELYFLECALGAPRRRAVMPVPHWMPQGVLVIGNSFGWSSFALALLCPQAQVVAIEIGAEPFTAQWIPRCNAIAQEEGLPLTVVQGASPQAVAPVMTGDGPLAGMPLDLALIDGHHTCAQVALDLAALAPFLHPGSVILCHDVLAFGLMEPVAAFARQHGLTATTLWGTPSGMVVLSGARAPLAVLEACYAFGGSALAGEKVALLRDMAAIRAGKNR